LSLLLSRCKIWSSARLLKFNFMVPQKPLPPGPKVWSLLQLLRFHGIVPESYFWFHVKSWRFDEPLSSDGNSPVRKFCGSATVVRTEQFPTPGGMVPVTRFLDRSRMRNLLRLPIWTGMLPVRLLDARCRTSGCCRVNPLRGGRQQRLQSLEKLRKYKGWSRRHEMATSPSPKIWPWSHSALKACSMSFCLSWLLIWLEDLMAFQVAMPTSAVASQDWSKTLFREYWPSKCLRHLSDQR
jgi:hypothetical protein